MKQGFSSPKIIVDSAETKGKLIEVSRKTGESMKDVIIRLVEKEHKKVVK